MINILNFEASNLKLDKKTSTGLDIYCISYVDKKPEWNFNSVNPLYLMINRIGGYFEKINSVKYLNIADTVRNNDVFKKYKQVFDGIKYHIKKIDNNNGEYQTDYKKIKFSSDDDILLNKLLYFPTITVTIRCAFVKDSKYYPKVYLDDCFYQV